MESYCEQAATDPSDDLMQVPSNYLQQFWGISTTGLIKLNWAIHRCCIWIFYFTYNFILICGLLDAKLFDSPAASDRNIKYKISCNNSLLNSWMFGS